MFKRKKEVYVIVGLQEDPNCGNWVLCNNDHGCHSSYKKARAELLEMLLEVQLEAKDNGYTFEYELYDNKFTGYLDDNIYIEYEIHKMIVN